MERDSNTGPPKLKQQIFACVQSGQGEELVRFKVLTAASMKITAFCGITSLSLVEVERRFVPMMKSVSISETSVDFYETIRRNITEGYYLHQLG
jgi:hypothetical protein